MWAVYSLPPGSTLCFHLWRRWAGGDSPPAATSIRVSRLPGVCSGDCRFQRRRLCSIDPTPRRRGGCCGPPVAAPPPHTARCLIRQETALAASQGPRLHLHTHSAVLRPGGGAARGCGQIVNCLHLGSAKLMLP